MNEYANESADIFNEDDKYAPKQPLFVRIIKWIGIAIIIVIVGCLLYRCATHRYEPSVSSKVLADAELVEAYNSNPEEFVVRRYGIQQPWVDVIERQGRLMEIKYLYYIPSTRQMQITLKYNVDIVPEKYSVLPKTGSFEKLDGFPFELALVDETGAEYTRFVYETGQHERFRFIRLCFDDVDIETSELDENNNPVRHSFYVKMKMLDDNGTYSDVCLGGMHKIYDGTDSRSSVFDTVKFEIE